MSSSSQEKVSPLDVGLVISTIWGRVFSTAKGSEARTLKQWDVSEIRYRAAKLCCENDPYLLCDDDLSTLSLNIQKFSLSKDQVFSLLCLLAEKEPNMIISRIQTFDLTLEQRYAIAEILSRTAPGSLMSNIELFCFDSTKLSKIATHLFDAPADCLIMNIQKFKSVPSEIRFEIAKICSLQDPYTTCSYIQAFQLNIRERFAIAKLCAEQSPYAVISHIKNFDLETEAQLREIANFSYGMPIDQVINHIDGFQLKEIQILDQLRLSELKEHLLESVLGCIYDEKMKVIYEQLIEGLKHPNYYATHPGFYIICAMIAQCVSIGIQLDPVNLRDYFYGFVGKDSAKLKQMVFVFAKILTSDELCLEAKEKVLTRLLMCSKDKLGQDLEDMRILCNLGRYGDLSSDIALSDCVRLAVKDVFPDDFQGSLYSLFNDTRILSPHILFAAQLMSLDESGPLHSFQKCIASICLGTFFDERYSPVTNPHLERLVAYDPKILELWRQIPQIDVDTEMVLADTDVPIDLLLFGTDISTCQNIQIGNPDLSRGVVGTMMNGQTRMLCVKKPTDGRIVARAMIRLLWDGDKPVLFLDRFYGDGKFEASIRKLAIKKAKVMGLILTEKSEVSENPLYERSLYSLGGRACEYCDGFGDGISEDGSFTIVDVSLINES